MAAPAIAMQVDIHGPPGSGYFGSHVALLPNGNIVVTDPGFSTASARHVGAIYLYDSSANLISTLTGSSENDNVGEGQIVVLGNGNFVVSTPDWNNGSALAAGAVTWINAVTGLTGVVSAQNSLVGTTTNDYVGGYNRVVALSNGNYVVASPGWSNGMANNAGAVTWADGATGIIGAVSPGNSLVGTEAGDFVGQDQSRLGGVVPLPNGNYVVSSSFWHFATQMNYGAVTWGRGSGGTVGPVSRHNSLLETTDCLSDVGAPSRIAVLTNGNYFVASPCWSMGSKLNVGALTWVDGSKPFAAQVSPGNSLVGAAENDHFGLNGATILSNGNAVVLSPFWNGGVGAATWVDGNAGLSGPVSAKNSLVGSIPGDYVGLSATPLDNGSYVVLSWWWNGPQAPGAGAATWADGRTGTIGMVSAANSLVGTTELDHVGFGGITALRDGHYVVASPYWSHGGIGEAGAATWLDGSKPVAGSVSSANSLVGSRNGDHVGTSVTALTNGNYVVVSRYGSAVRAIAATWGDGSIGTAGIVDVSNSLVGTYSDDFPIYLSIVPLANGNYVVANYRWTDGHVANAGAATWADGKYGVAGFVSASNSLVGTTDYQYVGIDVFGLSDGNYLVTGSTGQGGYSVGTLTLADGLAGLTGHVQSWNTLFASISYLYPDPPGAYDAARKRIIVGRPDENIVTLFSVTDQIFAAGFESSTSR